MTDKNVTSGVISVDDHVQQPPELWTRRLSKAKWGNRLPHLERQSDGTERWVLDGTALSLSGAGLGGALMDDRNRVPQTWKEVPKAAYVPAERLRAMNADGIAYSALYPAVAGAAG